MVLYKNATLIIAQVTETENNEGTVIRSFDYEHPVETIRADVQPNTLTQFQLELYGINTKNANVKKCFYDYASYMKIGNRVKVLDDNGDVGYYSIMPENVWRKHRVALLIPIENEQ